MGGRPPSTQTSYARNGIISSSAAKASAESLDYVVPSLPSSGSGQSPTKGVCAVGYQPITGSFPVPNGNDDSQTSNTLPIHQLPPVSPPRA